MTHTLHRRGSNQALAGDWVIIAMAARQGAPSDAAQRLRKFLRLALSHEPVNWGDMARGGRFQTPVDSLLAEVDARSLLHAVFTDVDRVAAVLADLRRADLRLSVVVSGLLEETASTCRRVGLDPARGTVQFSLGVWGDHDQIPEGDVLEAVSMCGHGLVAATLVERTAAAVAAGRITASEGARELAGPCTCGVFNPARAAELLARLAARSGSGRPKC